MEIIRNKRKWVSSVRGIHVIRQVCNAQYNNRYIIRTLAFLQSTVLTHLMTWMETWLKRMALFLGEITAYNFHCYSRQIQSNPCQYQYLFPFPFPVSSQSPQESNSKRHLAQPQRYQTWRSIRHRRRRSLPCTSAWVVSPVV